MCIHFSLFPFGFLSYRSAKCRASLLSLSLCLCLSVSLCLTCTCTRIWPLLSLQLPSIFCSLTSWPITSENKFFSPHHFSLSCFSIIGCQKKKPKNKKQILSQVINSEGQLMLHFSQGKKNHMLCNQPLNILKVSKKRFQIPSNTFHLSF